METCNAEASISTELWCDGAVDHVLASATASDGSYSARIHDKHRRYRPVILVLMLGIVAYLLSYPHYANADCNNSPAATPVTVNDEANNIPNSRQMVNGSGTAIDTSVPGKIKVNVSLPNSGVTAGSYTNANVSVNAQGIVTSATNGSGGGGSTTNALTAGNLPATVPNAIVPANGLIQPLPMDHSLALSASAGEFSVPTSSSNALGICAGPDQNIWFTEFNQNKIGKMTVGKVFTEYTIPTAGSAPWGICTGPDGNLWFTEQSGNKIGKITVTGTVTEYSIATSSSQPVGICAGPDGNLWFTENSGNKIGKITPSGTITEYSVTTSASQPRMICAGPDGNLWFTETAGNKIASITTSGTVTEYTIPTSSSAPYNICTGSDGNLWFTESATNKVGKLTTSGTFVEYSVPTSSTTPYGICAGPDGNLWFCEYATDKIASLTTTGILKEYALPSTGTGASYICVGPDGALWLTEQSSNKIAAWQYTSVGAAAASITTGTWASRPTSSLGTQRLYIPTDSQIQVIDNASSLEYRAYGYNVTPPVSSDFTTYDPGSASTISADNSHGGVIFTVQNPTSGHHCNFLKSISSPSSYTVTIGIEPLVFDGPCCSGTGISVQDSSSGKSVDFQLVHASGVYVYGAYHRNADTTWNSTIFQSSDYTAAYSAPMRFFRIVNNGTNRQFQVSIDGYSWLTLGSESSGTWISEDKWGPVVGTEGATTASTVSHVLHVKDGTP